MALRLPPLMLAGLGAALLALRPVPAQGAPRLVDAIEAPMLYLALGADAEPAGAAGREGSQRRAVQRLLADPGFDALFGGDRDAAASSSARALALVRGVLGRSSGEIEIALTGVVPAAGQPLLVLRAQLQADEAERLQGALADPNGGLAAAHRRLNGAQTYAMLGATGQPGAGAGEQVELALVGTDLLVANDATAIEELLAPAAATRADRRVLASDPRYLRLQRQVEAPAGALVVYGDWQRLGRRLDGGGAGNLPGFMLRWSGLGSARAVMATLAGGEQDFTGTVLLDFDRAAPASERGPRRRSRHEWGDLGLDGWFASALSIPAKTLVQDLPEGGLGGLVLAVDLRDIAGRSHRGAELLGHLRRSFKDFGLDFERNVLSRLGERGTVQLLFRRGDGAAPTEIDSVYAVRATSKKAASDLFTDLRRAAEQRGTGRLLEGRARRVEVLELRPRPDAPATFVAIQDAAVLIAFDPATIEDFLEESQKAQKQRGRRDAAVGKAIQKIGGSDVTGLFDLDFTPWFDRISELLGTRSAAIDLSGIPRRHVGYLDLQPSPDGLVLRVCVLSSR